MGNGIIQKVKWLFILWLARRLPDCKEMTRALGESLDRRPSIREKLIMKLHLFTCEACERYLEQVSFLKGALHAHGERAPETSEFIATELTSESKTRIKDLLRKQLTLAV